MNLKKIAILEKIRFLKTTIFRILLQPMLTLGSGYLWVPLKKIIPFGPAVWLAIGNIRMSCLQFLFLLVLLDFRNWKTTKSSKYRNLPKIGKFTSRTFKTKYDFSSTWNLDCSVFKCQGICQDIYLNICLYLCQLICL